MDTPAASLDDIIITPELCRRPARPADLEAENRSLHRLARQMASEPEPMLDELLHIALDLCHAGTAGVSLLESSADDGEIFRWVALAGCLSQYVGGTTPRHHSPCGVCLERGAPQLYARPGRRFLYLDEVEPLILEGLVIPLRERDGVLGTIWIVSHDEARKFDAEDARVMTSLGDFTAAALRLSASSREIERLSSREIERLYAEAQKADAMKDEFLAMLGHELRNPLAPILTSLQIIRMRSDVPVRVKHLDIIERQVHTLSRLVDDLLDVARISRGKIELRKEPVDLAAILRRAVETVRPLIDARRHQLSIGPLPEIMVEADPIRLEQVFSNLLSNAAKYTEPGGRITLTCQESDEDVVIRLNDNGVGIPNDVLPHIFEPFMQAKRSLDRAQGGLGLGLTLVSRLVAMHGGSVNATSEGPGRGSEFVVRLPRRREAPALAAAPANGGTAARTGARGPLHILIVDDNVDAAESVGDALAFLGHHARVAHDGEQAVTAALESRPDLVFLDIGLPGMDGYEVVRRLRAQPSFEHTRFIAVSGYGQEQDRRQALEVGFDDHLVKPVELARLQQVIAQLG